MWTGFLIIRVNRSSDNLNQQHKLYLNCSLFYFNKQPAAFYSVITDGLVLFSVKLTKRLGRNSTSFTFTHGLENTKNPSRRGFNGQKCNAC